ncbi:MAG: hypothetical protein WCS80_00620 [Bacilli bacterium]
MNINDKVIDRNGRIFKIESLVNKDFGNGPTPYFVLCPMFSYDFNPGYRCFVPSDKADNILRPIMNREEALELIDSLESLESFSNVNPRERKVYFQNVVSKGNRSEICRVIKTLTEYREERKKENKPFSDFDQRLLASLQALFDDEISLALNIPTKDVNSFIKNRVN